jgi:hypothetical protein
VSERLLEELDYALEAGHQRRFARAYRGHPFIRVPDVVAELSRRRVLVSEWVEGRRFAAVSALDQPARDRFGEIVYRFYMGAIRRIGWFNADPHPGNYLLCDDGRVAFFDFGAVKEAPAAVVEQRDAVMRAFLAGDPGGVERAAATHGLLPGDRSVDQGLLTELLRCQFGWTLDDGEVAVDPGVARRKLEAATGLRSEFGPLLQKLNVPAEDAWFLRMELGLVAALGRLRARGCWSRIEREFWLGEEPPTELGRQDSDFFVRPG